MADETKEAFKAPLPYKKVGKDTGYKTTADRPLYMSDDGELVSEKSITLKMDGKYVNVPSIQDGVRFNERQIKDMLKQGKIEPTSVHDTRDEAVQAAKTRSSTLIDDETSRMLEAELSPRMYNEGGAVLEQDGGSVDPVSGNEVPVGSSEEEVRDDVEARLSEGEFVLPADVVRYHGLEKIMALRDEAKMGLERMEQMGQMGNSDEAVVDPNGTFAVAVPLTMEDMEFEDEESGEVMEYQAGGFVNVPGTVTTPGAYTPGSMPAMTLPNTMASAYNPNEQTTPLQQQPVPSPAGPQYDPTANTQETRKYVNDAGDVRYIPFLNGQPLFAIPLGYKPFGEQEERAKETGQVQVQPSSVVNQDRGGGYATEGDTTPDTVEGDVDDIGGWSTVGGIVASALGVPSLIGSVMGAYADVKNVESSVQDVNPSLSLTPSQTISGILADITNPFGLVPGGIIGTQANISLSRQSLGDRSPESDEASTEARESATRTSIGRLAESRASDGVPVGDDPGTPGDGSDSDSAGGATSSGGGIGGPGGGPSADAGAAASGQGGDAGGGDSDGGGGSSGCFHEDTQIKMADGTTKAIKNVRLGDITAGGVVTMKAEFSDPDWYDYKGVKVSGTHAVKENGKFVRVENSENAVKLNYGPPFSVTIDTTDHRIYINDIEFADYIELDYGNELERNLYVDNIKQLNGEA